ncbi:MAG TPA: FAD-dependent oxidoreductase, partial [Rhodoglobus sp.]|nr:FAD-dependent oxidoreductase [Rhodoglobus sp.]
MIELAAGRRPQKMSVVIIGGGYAGMIAANRLTGSLTEAEAARVQVTIVNPSDRFVHRITLHEFAGGGGDPTHSFESMVGPRVRIVVGLAERVDATRRRVRVTTAQGAAELPYDRLIYAVGSRPATGVPGVARFAHTIGDLHGATDIRDALSRGATEVLVVGGGPTGIETAAELAEAYPRSNVRLLTGRFAAGMRPVARRRIARGLRRLGVEIVEGARVRRVDSRGVETETGGLLHSDVTVWAAQFDVPELATESRLPVDANGRLLVDETLACVGHPEIIGAGDAVHVPAEVGAHLGMGARTALPLGLAAAERVLADLRGQVPQPISIGLLGPSISLGRKDGYFQLTHADDSPRRMAFTGRAGAAVKAWVCRMTI